MSEMDMTLPLGAEVKLRRSERQGELVGALAKAKLKFPRIVKGVENPFYSEERKRKVMYADLAQIIDAIEKPMAEEGLVIIQEPLEDSKRQMAGCVSTLAHSSGEWRECELLLPATAKVKNYATQGGGYTWGTKYDAQTIGSAITYARRYTQQAQANVAAEDDDANSIMAGSQEQADEVAARKIVEANERKAKQSPTQNQAEAVKSDPVAQQTPNKAVEKVKQAPETDRQVFFSYPWEKTGDLCLAGPGCKLMIDYLIFTAMGVLDTEDETWRITGSTKIIALFDKFRELNIVYKELETGGHSDQNPAKDGGVGASSASTLPVITKADMGKGKVAGCMFVEWGGDKYSCFDKKLHPYLVKGKQADLITSVNGKYLNITGIRRVGEITFDSEGRPEIQRGLL